MDTLGVWNAAFAQHFNEHYRGNQDAVWAQFDYIHNRCPTDAEMETLNAQARQMTAREAETRADLVALALRDIERSE